MPQHNPAPTPPANQQALPQGMDLKGLLSLIKSFLDALLHIMEQRRRHGCSECEELAMCSLNDALCIARAQVNILTCCPSPEPVPQKV